MANITIKRYTGSTWGVVYPKTTIANVANLSSTLADMQGDIDDKEPSFSKNTAFNKNFGSAAGTVAEGNDYRLSNARTPTAHSHTKAQITDFAHNHDDRYYTEGETNTLLNAKQNKLNLNSGKVLGRTKDGQGEVEELDLIDIGEITPSSWTQVWSGNVNLNSYRSSYYSATVPSNSYIGKRIAIEVQLSTSTTYTSKIIFGVLGSSTTAQPHPNISRGIGWSYFDGTYLRVKTLYTYTSTSNTTTIYVGNLKTLLGTFSGTTIDWSTSHSETLYMRKIWVIG